jgi:hypothetical protein
MFNTTHMSLGGNSQTVQFNAPCTGILQRSNPKSIFVRFQKNSKMENMVFPDNGTNPYIHQFEYYSSKYKNYKDTDGKVEVVVLQILIFGDNQYLVEVIEPKYLVEENTSNNVV